MRCALSVSEAAGLQTESGYPNPYGLLIPMSNLSNIAAFACRVIEPGDRHFANGFVPARSSAEVLEQVDYPKNEQGDFLLDDADQAPIESSSGSPSGSQ